VSRTVAEKDPAQQLADADAAWRALRRDARADPAKAREAAVALVIAARLAGKYQQAVMCAKEAADALDKLDPTGLALVDAHACMSCLDAGDVDQAEAFLAHGRARARPPKDDETQAALSRAEGNVHLARRRWPEAIDAFDRGLQVTVDPIERTIALYNMGEANIRLEKWREARDLFLKADVDKRKANDRWGLSYVWWGIGACTLALGDANKGLEAADEGIAFVRTLMDPKISSRLATLRARCLAALAQLEQADAAARDAVRESTRAALPRERADAHLALAEVQLARNLPKLALHAAEHALDLAQKGGVVELAAKAAQLRDRAKALG
jgi:tetratricopeptide (TPR) repeat protein